MKIVHVFWLLTPLIFVINDQIAEVDAINLSPCNSAEKLVRPENVEEGKFNILDIVFLTVDFDSAHGVEQTQLNQSQQLLAPYKQLIGKLKQNWHL